MKVKMANVDGKETASQSQNQGSIATDWDECVICQKNNSEVLTCPMVL